MGPFGHLRGQLKFAICELFPNHSLLRCYLNKKLEWGHLKKDHMQYVMGLYEANLCHVSVLSVGIQIGGNGKIDTIAR